MSSSGDHYQYLDSFFNSCEDTVDSGSTQMSHGFPSDSSYIFDAVATASNSSSSSQVHARVNPVIQQVICVLNLLMMAVADPVGDSMGASEPSI